MIALYVGGKYGHVYTGASLRSLVFVGYYSESFVDWHKAFSCTNVFLYSKK